MPWNAIIQSQDDFVARKYLPSDVDLKEPSKLQNRDTTALLNCWYAQQESGETQTFLFKAWKNKDGDMVISVVSSKPPSHPTRNIRKKQRVIVKSPQDYLPAARCNTHHTEEDADDDSADGRPPQKRPRRAGGPPSASADRAVAQSIPKPRPVKTAKSGAPIEPSSRTTRSMSLKPSDNTPQVTRVRGRT
jgi:hypothetical protein